MELFRTPFLLLILATFCSLQTKKCRLEPAEAFGQKEDDEQHDQQNYYADMIENAPSKKLYTPRMYHHRTNWKAACSQKPCKSPKCKPPKVTMPKSKPLCTSCKVPKCHPVKCQPVRCRTKCR